MAPMTHDMAGELGRNVRALRKSKSLTLKQLAGLSGLSVGFLSHVERGRKKPSLSTLQKISAALGMEVGWFFPEHPGADPAERPYVVRKAFRRKIAYSPLAGTDYLGEIDYLLSPNIDGAMVMVMMEFQPGCSSGDDLFTHDGEEVGYVLSGELALILDDRALHLKSGDSFGFGGAIPHRYVNEGTAVLQIILVNAPVIFGVRRSGQGMS